MDLRRGWERALVNVYSRSPERPRRAVMRLFTPSYRVGVLVVLQRLDGRVLLVDQPYLAGWSLPGGNLDRRETPVQGARRELREELGLELEVPAPELAHVRTHDRWVTFVVACAVSDEVADAVRPGSEEISRVAWFAPEGMPELTRDAQGPWGLVRSRLPH